MIKGPERYDFVKITRHDACAGAVALYTAVEHAASACLIGNQSLAMPLPTAPKSSGVTTTSAPWVAAAQQAASSKAGVRCLCRRQEDGMRS
jgi:hypothetical protein